MSRRHAPPFSEPTTRSREFRAAVLGVHGLLALALAALLTGCGPQTFRSGDGDQSVVLASDAVMVGDMAIPVVPEGLTTDEAGSGPPAVIFLNFDGPTITNGGWSQNDAALNQSFMVNGTLTVPAFDHRPWGTDRAAVIAAVVAGVQQDFAAWGVQVTSTRPVSGRYTMMVFGGMPDMFGRPDNVIGLAPLDTDNWNQSDIGFVFTENIAPYKYTARQMAWVASHEIGHTIGLRHIEPHDDIMAPAACHCAQHWGAGPIAEDTGGEQDDRALLSTAYGVSMVPPPVDAGTPMPDGGTPPASDAGMPGPIDAGFEPPAPAAPRFDISLVSVKGVYKPFAGDFDGDGISDIFWYAPGQAPDSIWFGNESRQFTSVSKTVNGNYKPVVGDFNGDGLSDIYWYAPGSGADSVWFGQKNRTTRSVAWPQPGTFTTLAGDFNGDGTTDLFFYAPGTGTDELWLTDKQGGYARKLFAVDGTFKPIAGDFNGDGRADIYWYGQGTQQDEVWLGRVDGSFEVSARESTANVVPVVGDFNGDSAADIFWYGVGNIPDVVDFGRTDGQFTRVITGIEGTFTPVAGDFNADGQDDIVWYSRSDGASQIWGGAADGTFSAAARQFITSATTFSGDFDGDGAADVFLYGSGSLADRLAWGRP